jgi:hypothetical protein
MWRAASRIERGRYSPAEVIQAAYNIITVAINESADKEAPIQATERGMKTGLERAIARERLAGGTCWWYQVGRRRFKLLSKNQGLPV